LPALDTARMLQSVQTLMILCGLVGFAVFAWGLFAALAARDRRALTERRSSLRLGSPGRRLGDLITLPAETSTGHR
jgi:hypothetical protein